jgi:hypothetical protein
MNIFALHPKQRKCARWHCDKHVVKMILETCQLLYTAHWVLHYPQLRECKSPIALSRVQKTLEAPDYMKTAPLCATSNTHGYRPCHVNHPSAVWARKTSGNYEWLVRLGWELAQEFTYRFNKKHSCEDHITWLYHNYPPTIRAFPRTQFSMAMGEEFKISKDPIRSYRYYYNTSKKERGLLVYSGRHPPHWLTK